MPVHCGEIVAERYRVERLLGVGGMGTVVAARHLSLGELVAIKFMRAEYCGNPALLRRFQREARGMFRLKGEHVPRILDLGSLAPRPGLTLPVPFIVMEHLSGNDLRSIMERRGRLPVEEAAEYVRQACVALTEAHALGMVHRDLKPANLFLTYRTDGTPLIKILDFGVAKFTCTKPEDDGLEMTTARSVMGSRRYMAPEQMLTPRDVDLRADVWALGVVLYQLVSGALPFAAETLEQLVIVVTEQPPRPLGSVCAGLPEGFEQIVMRCLEKNRSRRPASVGELAAALAPFALRGPPDATLPTGFHRSDPTFTWREQSPPPTAVRPAETPRREGRRGPKSRAWLAAAAVGALSASAALGAAVLPSGWPRPPASTWAEGASAQRLAGVSPGLAAELPAAALEGPLPEPREEPRDAAGIAARAGAAGAGHAPPGEVGDASLVACDTAGLVLPAKVEPLSRASAARTQRAPARPARPARVSGISESKPAAPAVPASPAALSPPAAPASPAALAALAAPASVAALAAPAAPSPKATPLAPAPIPGSAVAGGSAGGGVAQGGAAPGGAAGGAPGGAAPGGAPGGAAPGGAAGGAPGGAAPGGAAAPGRGAEAPTPAPESPW
ncbi:serine/threonine-protein kinase [Sorangium sp. So ce131]|uniref:serine/threonine-protein kinase n=1 Tax=Sorangium sp. So ce131 TaxID=3133282 RepID=UPI003F5E5911